MLEAKKWYYSKTLWVNALFAIGILLQSVTGTEVLDAEVQAAIIVLINFILRLVTKSGLEK